MGIYYGNKDDPDSARDGQRLTEQWSRPKWQRVGVAPTLFLNGWTNFASGYQYAEFTKDGFGTVWVRGVIASGTVGSRAFFLPAGYRPSLRLIFPTITNGTLGRVDVDFDGSVIPFSPSSNIWVPITFSFSAEPIAR